LPREKQGRRRVKEGGGKKRIPHHTFLPFSRREEKKSKRGIRSGKRGKRGKLSFLALLERRDGGELKGCWRLKTLTSCMKNKEIGGKRGIRGWKGRKEKKKTMHPSTIEGEKEAGKKNEFDDQKKKRANRSRFFYLFQRAKRERKKEIRFFQRVGAGGSTRRRWRRLGKGRKERGGGGFC